MGPFLCAEGEMGYFALLCFAILFVPIFGGVYAGQPTPGLKLVQELVAEAPFFFIARYFGYFRFRFFFFFLSFSYSYTY